MENIAKLNHFGEDVSNSELVKKSQLGDKSAFEELVKRHQDLVFSLSFKLTGNRELANDVAQEAFIRAWKAIDKFRGDSTFGTWIYRITVNTAWTLRKKAKKHYSLNYHFNCDIFCIIFFNWSCYNINKINDDRFC